MLAPIDELELNVGATEREGVFFHPLYYLAIWFFPERRGGLGKKETGDIVMEDGYIYTGFRREQVYKHFSFVKFAL